MEVVEGLISVSLDIILFLSALHTSVHLFKDHRAPSVGFFLVACSSFLAFFPSLSTFHKVLDSTAEVLCPVLCAFGFMWLSEDRSTALSLLIGSSLFPLFSDRLSADGVVIMSRCVTVSALSCWLTACLFSGNAAGVLGGVALSLPALVAPRGLGSVLDSVTSPQAAPGLLRWGLKALTSTGCWTTKKALDEFFQDLKGWD